MICGAPQFAAIDRHAATNPTLLVEVTSPSTEDYDRGDKLSHFKQLPSLQAVLIVSYRAQQLTLHRRTAGGWEQVELRAGERLVLEAPALSLAVDDAYRGVALD